MSHLLGLDLHQNQLRGVLAASAYGVLDTSAKIAILPTSFIVMPEVPCVCRGPPAVMGDNAQPAEDQHLAEQLSRRAA